MTHSDTGNKIPTWAGKAPLRWHISLVLGIMLGSILAIVLGGVL